MNVFVPIGPFSIPLNALLLIIAAALVLGLAGWRGRKTGVNIEGSVWLALLAGVIAARLGFVLGSAQAYFAAPLTLLDIRDGGWNPWWGLGGIWLCTILLAHRRPSVRVPLLKGMTFFSSVVFLIIVMAALPTGANRPLPHIPVTGVSGEPASLPAFAGKPTVINLWASWCGPCRREMPVFEDAQADNPDVNFVFLNQGEDRQTVQAFLQANRLQLDNVLLDRTAEMGHILGQRGLPVTLFYSADGNMSDIRLGELSAGSLVQRLDALKAEQAAVGVSD